MPTIKVWIRFWSSFLLTDQVVAQVLASLSLTWETQMEFRAPGFGLEQHWLLQASEEQTSGWKIYIALPLK